MAKLMVDWPDGVRLLEFPECRDSRGVLVPMDTPDLPFLPKRIFVIEGSEGGSIRGGHSHRSTRQILYCVAGRVEVEAHDDCQSMSFELVPDGRALLVEPGVWASQKYRSPKDRLLVLASEPYSSDSSTG